MALAQQSIGSAKRLGLTKINADPDAGQ